MRTPLGFLLGVGLACGSAPARGEDAERHAVTGFVADCRAGKAPEACAVWWDGESVGARVFVAEWAAQPEGVRAEIGGLLAKAIQGEARELLAAAQAVAQGGGVKFEQDEPISLPDVDGLRAVAVPMRLAVGKKQQAVRLRLLLTRSSPPRLTDWAWDEHPWTATAYARELARWRAHGHPDLLTFAWVQFGRGEPPPPSSLLYAPPAPPMPEWAVRDLPRMTLSVVPGARADVPREVPPEARWGPRVVLGLEADGMVSYRGGGRRSPLQRFPLDGAPGGSREEHAGLALVRAALADAAGTLGARAPDGSSVLDVVVRADRRSSWGKALRLASLATDPSVQARDVAFVVSGSALDRPSVIVVSARALRPPQERAEGTFTLKLFRKNVERAARDHFTRVRLGESQTIDLPPRGDDPDAVAAEVWAPVREALRVAAASRGAAPATCAVLMPYPSGPAVPLEDVLAAVQLVQEAGLSVVALSGG